MKQIIFIVIMLGLMTALTSCGKDEGHICSNRQAKVLGECIDTARHDFIFSGYPDFYCFNDSVAIGINKKKSGNTIYVKVFPYIQDRGIGKNWLTGGSRSSISLPWKFYEHCYESPEDRTQYYTFLFVQDWDKITEETKEIHCRLELRDGISTGEHDPEIISPSAVLDSSTVVLKRVFY